jgi:N-acetyltransferase 10
MNRGYGTRAVELLTKYYEGLLLDVDNIKENEIDDMTYKKVARAKEGESLQTEKIKPKKQLKPLLQKLSERKPIKLNYLGTSFGVTLPLFNFWDKSGFKPVYVRQTPNELTGEHTCIMIRPLQNDED